MTLKETIDRELSGLAQGGLLAIPTPSGQLDCQVTAVDSIGCAFERLELKTDRLADASMDRLKKVSDALAARLSYLLEPITRIESDPDEYVVQMRSHPPTKDNDARSYYELTVRRGGALCLVRYKKALGDARQAIPANVTREVFHRLVADFDSAVA